MAKRYSRKEVLERLHSERKAGRPLIMFGAGIGLTARCAEKGGVDLIGVYSTAIYRMRGQPSLLAWLPYGDANRDMLNMAGDILPSVKETPCIAGIGAHDPCVDLDSILEQVKDMGFSGINNEPFSSMYGPFFADQLESAGIGFSREMELVSRAREHDLLSVAWAMTPEEAEKMTRAGADVVGAMIGVTTGGMSGASKTLSLEEATEKVREMAMAAKRVNPDVFVLTHGGPFSDVATAQYSIANTVADGYASGSSGERVPTEEAVVTITRNYKAMHVS